MDDDDDDDFYDTLSVNSQLVAKRRAHSRDYINLSRSTVYHSALDLEMELNSLNNLSDEEQPPAMVRNKVSKKNSTPIITYSQWRERNWSVSKDGHSVDFVLAYENGTRKERDRFKKSLEEVGLTLEEEAVQNIHFLKVHVPDEVLRQYAEILKLRMPLKLATEPDRSNILMRFVNKTLEFCNVSLDDRIFPPRKYQLTAEYMQNRDYLYDTTSPDYFNTSTRIIVASYILERERYGDGDHDVGIKKLLADGIYKAAYPLHDGSLRSGLDNDSMRKKLLNEWAAVSKWAKYQPIDEIKDYFGVKIALYFAWLGFYTHMLIPASIVGILCVLYGLLTMGSDHLSEDICTLDRTMCPLCDKYCPFWQLKDTCVYSKISYIIDNPVTVFFAVFMSVWAALYLEFWKRYSAGIAHRWGLTGFDLQCEPPRPEYFDRLAHAKKRKLNVVTSLSEPVVPFWKMKLPAILLSCTMVLIFMLLAVAVVFGIVIYRMSLITSEALYSDKTSFRIYVVPITAGIINLLCIVILNNIYYRLAYWLTEMEVHRTQTEFEESLTLKIYLFQFINYYTSIFYIAFIKGKFVGYPAKYNKIFGYRQEECQPGGCLMELTIQLAIIMVGNQALNSIMEIVIPFVTKMINKLKFKVDKETDQLIQTQNQWTDDYKLLDLEPQGLFNEYLEMVLQYGFVTIFVTAFPLAPLFALINNIFEMRLDAKKMIKYFRRPVPKRVKDIGVWYTIMNMLCRVSIVSNAFIIAFSSQFIPKLVYMMKLNKEHTEEGFLDFTLASFDTSDFQFGAAPEDLGNVTICHFAEYRNSHDISPKYKRPIDYWHITAARLAFVVVYQNLVGILITAIQNIIPDVPRKLYERIQREGYQINESIIKKEKEMRQRGDMQTSLQSTELSFIDENVEGELRYEDQNGDVLHRRHRPNSEENSTTNL